MNQVAEQPATKRRYTKQKLVCDRCTGNGREPGIKIDGDDFVPCRKCKGLGSVLRKADSLT